MKLSTGLKTAMCHPNIKRRNIARIVFGKNASTQSFVFQPTAARGRWAEPLVHNGLLPITKNQITAGECQIFFLSFYFFSRIFVGNYDLQT